MYPLVVVKNNNTYMCLTLLNLKLEIIALSAITEFFEKNHFFNGYQLRPFIDLKRTVDPKPDANRIVSTRILICLQTRQTATTVDRNTNPFKKIKTSSRHVARTTECQI